jgi:predicted nucleotidyltransferase
MNRATVLQTLSEHNALMVQRFGVASLALFGSTARDAATPDSDVDLLVSFIGPATSAQFFGVQFYLEDLLGCSVDLVTEKALRPELRPYVLKDAVHV